MMSFTSWDVFQKNSMKRSCKSTHDMGNNKFLCLTKKILWLIFAFFWTIQSAAGGTILHKSSDGVSFQVNKIAEGLGVPWGMVFISPDQILFTERNGKIGILVPASGKIIRITGGPKVMHFGQGGLLDVAVPPDYKPGDWIYFTYSKEQRGKGVTALARARKDGNRLIMLHDLLVTRSESSTSRHFGSRIAFDGAGHLFFSVGDRGVRPNAQNLATHVGPILRLALNGSIPEDNPFVHHENTLPEIWSYGHRNPQGIFYDMELKRLWAIGHGTRGGDEIILIVPGPNYVWPVTLFGRERWVPVQVCIGT